MELELTVTRKQKRFIDAGETEVLFGGAAGGGKSYAQVIDALLFALRYPRSRQLLLRRTFPELQMSILRTVRDLYPAKLWDYNVQQHTGRFRNGSVIDFGYIGTEADLSRYQSAEFDVIRFDELTHFTEEMYTYLFSRLRGANSYPKQIKSSTNPGNVGHAWVKARFIDAAPPDTVIAAPAGTRRFIPSRVQDNRFLMESDPDYVERLKNLSENERKALLDGSWDVFEGQFFTEWDRERHVIEPFAIPKEWRRFRSMDWGYNDPCCVLWYAVGPDGALYVYRELYVRRVMSPDLADRVRALSEGEEIAYTAASPDMWAERGIADISGVTIAEVFAAHGVPLIKADDTRVPGWQRVREYLSGGQAFRAAGDASVSGGSVHAASDPLRSRGGAGRPRLRIFSTCVDLIRTLPAMTYDRYRTEDMGDGLEDHACESLRYGIMSRPRPVSAVRPAAREPVFDPLDTRERRSRRI